MPTVKGKYSSDSLGKDGTGPLKVREMEVERTRPKTVADGRSLADIIDRNSAGAEESNHGLTSNVKRGGK
jgi:hypothetical protein